MNGLRGISTLRNTNSIMWISKCSSRFWWKSTQISCYAAKVGPDPNKIVVSLCYSQLSLGECNGWFT